jgi:hypothetical protein
MATYDETVGSGVIPWDKLADGGFFRLEHTFDVATAIAAHATPAAASEFAINDILQLIDFPAGCVFLYSIFRTVTADASASTCSLGEAAGTEFDAAVDLTAAAGTVVVGVVAAGTEDDFYSAANTADLKVLTNVLATGEWVWSIVGVYGA